MTRAALLLAAPSLALLAACGPLGSAPAHVPLLSEVSAEADAQLALVDRALALDGALDAAVAPAGRAIDLGAAPEGFTLSFDGSDVQDLGDEAPAGAPAPTATFANVRHGVAMAAMADLAATAVVGPPALAIHVVRQGRVRQVAPNVWTATNSVRDGERELTGTLTAAWVNVGWLAEMRVTSSDGVYTDHKWFSGFLSHEGGIGWWDLYGADGQLAGVVEWFADGQGHAEFGIAAMAGEGVGDTLSYWRADDEHLIVYDDASEGEEAWVYVAPDRSGEMRLVNVNGGEPGCWAGLDAEIPYADTPCAEE